MKFWSRTFPAILGILALITGVLLFFITSGILTLQDIGVISFSHLVGSFPFLVAGVVIFIVGLLLLVISFRKEAQINSIAQQTQLGELKISHKTIESMILRISKTIKGIRDTTAYINDTEKGLIVYLKVKAVPEKPIPDLSLELQSSVKDYIEKIGGTSVAEVKVLIEDISSEPVN